jgi:hypothetical protein
VPGGGDECEHRLEVSLDVGEFTVNLGLAGVNLVPKFLKALVFGFYQPGEA